MRVSREQVEQAIASAFAGVQLSGGISLRQSEAIDDYCDGLTDAEFRRLPSNEITTDWGAVTDDSLESACVAHLDAKGFRYYVPRLMLSILDRYDSASSRVIGTLLALYPRTDCPDHANLYDALNKPQREAVALFLDVLPDVVDLGQESRAVVQRALRNYWAGYLR